jgi:hypothetical protein
VKKYSVVSQLVVWCALVVCGTIGLSHSPSYGQGRTLTATQLDAIVTPTLAQCAATNDPAKNGRLDPTLIVPTRNAREFPPDRIKKTLHGMWRGQVLGDNKEVSVDYFWIMDTQRNEGLIVAQRTGNQSTAGLQIANPPKITYLICPHEGYLPSMEGGPQIHQFVKVANATQDAAQVLQKATGLKFRRERATLSQLWQQIVASGYFKTLPAVAFAGGLFKPIRLERVASAIGPAQVSLSWNSEYYGGGATLVQFTPGVPMKGVEYTQFVGTTATLGDFLVASIGNGKLSKVEAVAGGNYDIAFDAVSLGPLQQ